MAKKIYLEGGGSIREGTNDSLDKAAIKELSNKSVLVLNLTTNDPKKIKDYEEFLILHFNKLGLKEVHLASKLEDNELKETFKLVGLLYLPGGDTDILLENIKQKEIENLIKDFKGVVVGNSAGAMILCQEAICANDGREIEDYLGILKLSIDVHYDETHDKKLFQLSQERKMYAIPEKSAIVVDENGELNFMGKIYLFSNGKKEILN